MRKIAKPTIVITSVGRTGTRFFAALFSNIISHSTSLHEPDIFQIVLPHHTSGSWRIETIKRIYGQFREIGFSYSTLKVLGRWRLIKVSDDRVRGVLSYDQALNKVLQYRSDFVNSRPGSVYIESNIAFYGLIDVIEDTFIDHKTVYIVRDGRSWVQSWMNWGEMYDKGKVRSLIAHTWPTALEIEDDPYAVKWKSMTRFERLCWAWTRLNTYALQTIEKNSFARVFRFEDIFHSDERYEYLFDLVSFVMDLPNIQPVTPSVLNGWLEQRIHKSSGDFSTWDDWSSEQKRQFREICGPLMEKLEYCL